MPDYSIKIINQCGSDQTYLLFQEAPKVEGCDADRVFSNIQRAAQRVPNDGNAVFKMSNNIGAICGTSFGPLKHNGRVNITAAKPVKLAKGDVPGTSVYLTVRGDYPGWDERRSSTTTSANAFSIVADKRFETRDKDSIIVGLAGPRDGDDHSGYIPTATFTAHQGEQYTIWPKHKYYITNGQYEQGTVIMLNQLEHPQEVDFETGPSDRTYVHNQQGQFVLQSSG